MSRSSIGIPRRSCQAGRISTGSRSINRTRKRNAREPAPITIEARSATEPGTPSSRIRSTSSRLARCGEGGCAGGSGPPRYTIRRTPARRAAEANRSAAVRSRIENVSPALGAGSIEWIRK